jgi:hypothetical protein
VTADPRARAVAAKAFPNGWHNHTGKCWALFDDGRVIAIAERHTHRWRWAIAFDTPRPDDALGTADDFEQARAAAQLAIAKAPGWPSYNESLALAMGRLWSGQGDHSLSRGTSVAGPVPR